MVEGLSRNDKDALVKQILDNDKDLNNYHIDEELMHELIAGKVSRDINSIHDNELTLGQRTADKIAAFGGSWTFIIGFGVVLFSWVALNTVVLIKHAFDPYPFIFLNLILSCLAAIQAPIIMMSQNRQNQKDRITAKNDYLVNIKTELIIEHLHYKLDEILENKLEEKLDILIEGNNNLQALRDEIKEIKTNQLELKKQLRD